MISLNNTKKTESVICRRETPCKHVGLLIFLCFLLGWSSIRADAPQQKKKEEQLVIKSTGVAKDEDAFKYDMKREVIVQGGGVLAHKGAVSLQCESLVAYMKEEEVYAEGNVILTDGALRITHR